MPWKNGQGETAEVAVAPEGAGLSAFDWRVSMASVTADGAFSAFPGVDRTLSVLSGAGIRLAVDGRARDLTAASAPFSFPADRPAEAALLGGPVTDLNVMTRRSAWTHRVRRIDVAAGIPVVPHVGDMGQIHQHLVLVNHIALGHDALFLEYIPHLRDHFTEPAIVEGGRYRTPRAPGASSDLR